MPPGGGVGHTASGCVWAAGGDTTPRCPGPTPRQARAGGPGHRAAAGAAVHHGGSAPPPCVSARPPRARSPPRGTQRAAELVGVRAAPPRRATLAGAPAGPGATMPPLGPGPGIGEEGRHPPDTAASWPHPRVPSRRGGITRRAARAAGAPPCLHMAPAHVLLVTRRPRAPTARAPPLATADAAAQAIRSGGMRAAGHWHVTLQAVRGRAAEGWP